MEADVVNWWIADLSLAGGTDEQADADDGGGCFLYFGLR